MSDLPPHVRAEVQRILDCEARRLLAEQQFDRDLRVPRHAPEQLLEDESLQSAPAPLRRPGA